MKTFTFYLILLAIFVLDFHVSANEDTLVIHNLGHASLMFEFNNLVIHVDPRSSEADYDKLPDADLVFITHAHGDHYELSALNKVTVSSTIMVCTREVKNKGDYSGSITVMANDDSAVFKGISVRAVPAYNHTASYHPKGVGNGYVFTFGSKKVYVAGDTENITEMTEIDADMAFLPMNLPYTMTQEQAVDAALMINPQVLYIYHFSQSDTNLLRSMMADYDSIEIRIGESIYYEYEGGSTKYQEPNEPAVNINNRDINMLEVYPNPVQKTISLDFFLVNTESLILNLYDVDGRLVKKIIKEDVATGQNHIEFNIESLSKGVYFYSIYLNNSASSGKFVITDDK